jgi:hypothetical protein
LTERAGIGQLTKPMPAPSVSSFRISSAIAWLRSVGLILFVLVVAPATAELLEELGFVVAGVECCDGDCCDGAEGCPTSCLHCACCPHATALLGRDELRLEPSLPRRRTPLGAMLAADAAGYRAPPFRPPLA